MLLACWLAGTKVAGMLARKLLACWHEMMSGCNFNENTLLARVAGMLARVAGMLARVAGMLAKLLACWHSPCWHAGKVDICSRSSACWHAGKMLLACWQSCCWHAGKVAGMPSTVGWGGLDEYHDKINTSNLEMSQTVAWFVFISVVI